MKRCIVASILLMLSLEATLLVADDMGTILLPSKGKGFRRDFWTRHTRRGRHAPRVVAPRFVCRLQQEPIYINQLQPTDVRKQKSTEQASVAMASTTNAAVIFGVLVFLQVSCAFSRHPTEGKFELRQNVPAVMTVNGFQEGEGGGGPASCDGQYHSDDEFVVSLSSEWYAGGARCGRTIRIVDTSNIGLNAKVVDECAGCDNEVGASSHIWKSLNLDTSQGEVNIRWSDLDF